MPSLGGAIACIDDASPRIENIIISSAMADFGAGIAVNNSDPIITSVSIDGTEARSRGAGIYLSNSNAEITAVTITNSTAYSFGGGIYMSNSSPTIKHVEISNNTANKGGGMFISSSLPILKYNSIHSNIAETKGGGIYSASNSHLNLMNITLWNNSAEDGGGVYFNNSRGQFLNSILWENTPSQAKIFATNSSNFIKVAHSNITDGEDGFESAINGSVYFYEGITSDDPRFANAVGGDLSLLGNSPFIDAGVTNYNFGEPSIASPYITEYAGDYPDLGGIETGYEVLSVEETVNNIPNTFILEKAFPNPFNPVTQFNYTLSEFSSVSINVYNINGELVDQLFDGHNVIGDHSAKWNAGNNPSGFYLISVVANGVEQVNKVLLMK